jgi:IS30 family transposase
MEITLRQGQAIGSDLIKRAFNRFCVGTLVERKTRYVLLCQMESCAAHARLSTGLPRGSDGYNRSSRVGLELPKSTRMDAPS